MNTTIKNLLCMTGAALALACASTSANAAVVSSLDGAQSLVMPAINYFGSAPQALTSNITWSSDYGYSVYGYDNGYGFNTNGSWGGIPMVGVNTANGTMTFAFTQAVSGFGGFLNFAGGYNEASIAAYDSNHTLLESYTLNFATGGGYNTGRFIGLQQASANISYFTMSNAYIGGSNFQVLTAPVPEPETYALMGMGLVGLLAARRRKQK